MTHAAWGNIETMTIAKTYPTLFEYKISETKPTWLGTLSKLPEIRGQSSRYSYSSCQTRNKKVLPDWIQSRISRCSPTNIRRNRSCQRVWSEFYSASPTTRSARCSRMPKWQEWIQMLDNRILWQVFKLILFYYLSLCHESGSIWNIGAAKIDTSKKLVNGLNFEEAMLIVKDFQ